MSPALSYVQTARNCSARGGWHRPSVSGFHLFQLLAGSGCRLHLGPAEGTKGDTPVTWLFQVQKFEDRLAIYIRRRVEPSDVQDRWGQVDV